MVALKEVGKAEETAQVQGQPGLHRRDLSQTTKQARPTDFMLSPVTLFRRLKKKVWTTYEDL